MKKILVLLLGLALCAPAVPVAAADAPAPVELHALLALTGLAAFLGAKEQESLRVLESVVNANGGINGRPLKIVFEDDQSNPQVAVQVVSGLVAQKVPLFLGPTLTAVCQAVAPLVDQNGPVSFCMSPTIIPRPGGYMFMSAPSIDDVEPFVLRFFRDRGLTRIALITSTDASGSDFEKRFDGVLARPEFKAMTLVAREHMATSDITVTAQIARIKAANPQALLSFTVGPPFGTLLRGIHDEGLDVPIYGSGGNFTYAQMNQYASFMPKELYLNGARGITPDAEARGATARAQNAYYAAVKAAGIRPEFSTSIPWDMAMIAVDALRRAGPNASAAQIHDYVEHLRGYTGIQGTYDFTTGDQRGLGEAAAALFRWDVAKGDFVLVAHGGR